MNLNFDIEKARKYSNKSQVARVLTELWIKDNCYCPNCGNSHLCEFENNKPVADFFCNNCQEQFELKSKKGNTVGEKIVDGAYTSMIKRIGSQDNPHFFFLCYSKTNWQVNNLLIIPKHYFISSVIEKRKPLSDKARRAGWVGCNIKLSEIPEIGRIFLIKYSKINSKEDVLVKWKTTSFLMQETSERKSWIIKTMRCVDKIGKEKFTLKEMYSFEPYLRKKYPENKHIKEKIRQQLQVLRDKGLIEFTGRGSYRKIAL